MTNPNANLGSVSYLALTGAGGTVPTDVTQWCRDIKPRYVAPRKDTTTMGNRSRRGIASFIENGYDIEGIYDKTVDAFFMGILGGTAAAGVYGPHGSASGEAKHSSNMFCTAYQPPSNVDEAVSFTATLEVNGDVTRTTF